MSFSMLFLKYCVFVVFISLFNFFCHHFIFIIMLPTRRNEDCNTKDIGPQLTTHGDGPLHAIFTGEIPEPLAFITNDSR